MIESTSIRNYDLSTKIIGTESELTTEAGIIKTMNTLSALEAMAA